MANFQTWSYILKHIIIIILCFLIILPISFSASNELNMHDPITLSSFHYVETTLKPYEWRYIRVDLPESFSSISINLKSDVDIDKGSVRKIPKSKMPVICLRNGGLPIPDVLDISLTVLSSSSNESIGGSEVLQLVEQCHPLQKTIMLMMTNEQISSGVWYIGLFNGIGSARTQSRMINRGSDFSFSANVTVEGCSTSAFWGQYCNQSVIPLSCAQSDVYTNITNHFDAGLFNQKAQTVTTCRNSFQTSCIGYIASGGYSLDVIGIVEQLMIRVVNVSLNESFPANNTGIGILYARHGAMPSSSLHDYGVDISMTPLFIPSPKAGRWYISILPVKQTKGPVAMEDKDITVHLCYSLDWQVMECPVGKAGPNCTSEAYMLQAVIRSGETYYLPVDEASVTPPKFLLDPLLSNSSLEKNYAWTYFLLDVLPGAAGGNIHFQLNSDQILNYEIYSRFGGLPSLDSWDYYYANKTSSSDGSVFFKSYDSSEKAVSFYLLYAKEGTWSFGLRHPVRADSIHERQTFMSIARERCPKGCSSPHGKCQNVLDTSGLTFYSYCSCDRDHGGFDCSIELVTHKGHIWQSIALIASNGAAILPAFWTLRQKAVTPKVGIGWCCSFYIPSIVARLVNFLSALQAFSEWVLFTSSGISSGLYHACDVGTWCALSFHVLQFMDFWLSFMAVVSTFVYLARIDEVSKRVIHTSVAILTALLAITGATRSSNIVLVIAIGALGLVIGWLIESSTMIRSLSFPTRISLNILER
ncbi:hypothetical protein IFM89_022729 [Coptis chinensis]|uniref:EGF-like domain-containing protein n=1 Tax=Coptis chinensis TaxID=261450 RepID=A0A835IGJ1_9MAGN|nr:hypothetical protein IFM89_022729 [Coptis chinensis]